MPVQIQEIPPRMLHVRASGMMEANDYRTMSDHVRDVVKRHGPILMLLELADFQGYSAAALWEEVTFDIRHCSEVQRLAIVADEQWHKEAESLCTPFSQAQIRYFRPEEQANAQHWLQEAQTPPQRPVGRL